MSDHHRDDAPPRHGMVAPIMLLPDGTVQMQQVMIDGIIQIVAQNCAYHAGDDSGDIVGAVLATCAGYAVGKLVRGRNLVPDMQAKLVRCVDAGMGDGLEDNRGLPRLHG